MEGFGKALRLRAQAIGLTDAEVARRAGLEEGRYGNYVRDAREPDLATLVRISRVLGTTPNALLGIADSGTIEHGPTIAAMNALDDEDRALANALLNAFVDHRQRRSAAR